MAQLKVVVFPQDSNPYQELLYAPMRAKGVEVTYLAAANTGPLRAATLGTRLLLHLLRLRLSGYSILHIHWLYSLGVPSAVPFSKQLTFIRSMVFIVGARLLGYHLVWTAHNVLPHSPVTSNDLLVRRQLVR